MSNKNYITKSGFEKLKDELHDLVVKERPNLVQVVNWAASNGDRSENADYIYGKRKLREIDSRIRALTKKIQESEVIDTQIHKGKDQIFFGASVTILRGNNVEQVVKIVGRDEIDLNLNYISWISPMARHLMGKKVGDVFIANFAEKEEEIEILEVIY